MATTQQSYWPDLVPPARTPVVVLREQAAALGASTKHLLEAEVRTESLDDAFVHQMFVVAPTIDYRYPLLWIRHGPEIYPILAGTEPLGVGKRIEDEDGFLSWLQATLSSDRTKKLLSTILAQVME